MSYDIILRGLRILLEEHLEYVLLRSILQGLEDLLTTEEVLTLDLFSLSLQVLNMGIINELPKWIEMLRESLWTSRYGSLIIIELSLSEELNGYTKLLLHQK